MNAHLQTIMTVAQKLQCAYISYRKPGEKWVSHRLIEPYTLSYSGGNLIMLAWQLDPFIDESDSWRNFRIDRIMSVISAEVPFVPRIAVSIASGSMSKFVFNDRFQTPPERITPEEEYFKHLEDTIEDHIVTKREMTIARTLAARLPPPRRAAIHAQLYASVLTELAMDGIIDEREITFLRNLKHLLDSLGWSP